MNRNCMSIHVKGNNFGVELNEIFYLSLQKISGQDSRIRLDPDDGQVVIKDELYEKVLYDVYNCCVGHPIMLFL